MTHRVRLEPQGIEFDVDDNQTVLEAALNQNIRFPHRCQVGACTACLCRKLDGKVDYQLEPMLTKKEREQGWIFPCLAYAETDLLLTLESE
ncbi:2Fe-2S iron-sulfur cluster-binding protein [Vibrio sp. SCSIO 43136]|uniref:2Fe-2S iron-sulfur cluster-binding protein n=1 Tax=Vibrio sp. SCSIO 43136 TaxID=2819101 RepID=UPI002075E25F|nr:2Fe-2S iron-sulfur cluster-binding protein [Vibrio sp. SCSIO 43136]USD65354.1 2Fe-2S iron-sulfur cluster binding domain-containing protein [Vibrio sp. SCSIO 43136]